MQPGPQDNTDFTRRLGGRMIAVAWILVLGLVTLFFSRYLAHQNNPNEEVMSYRSGEYAEVVLQRNRAGHYVASGSINGRPVDFLLDTGATMVSVPADIAAKLDLEHGPGMAVSTANGTVEVNTTRLDSVMLGEIKLRDVRATINPHMDSNEILLGMTFLKELEFSQQGDTLTIRQYLR